MIDGWGFSCEIGLRWLPRDLPDNQSTIVQVMGWCRQAVSHYLSQCWPRSLSPYHIAWPQRVDRRTPKLFWGNHLHYGVMTWKRFPRYWLLYEGITDHWVIFPQQRASNLVTTMFHCSSDEQTVKQIIELLAIWDAMTLMWCHWIMMIFQAHLYVLQCCAVLNSVWMHSWWRHQMEAFSALLTLCAGN